MSILDAIAPYKMLAEVVVIGSLFAGASYGVHQFLEHERDIGRNEVRAEYAKSLADAKEAARVRETELRAQRDDAINKGNEREQTIRSLAASAGASSNGLRDALAHIGVGVPDATIEALRNSTTTLATVLSDCQGRYRALAEVADRHANDARTLSDAWPTDAEKK